MNLINHPLRQINEMRNEALITITYNGNKFSTTRGGSEINSSILFSLSYLQRCAFFPFGDWVVA